MGQRWRSWKVIHVGFVSANVEEVFYPDAELIGDIGASAAALAGRLEGKLKPDAGCRSSQEKHLAPHQQRAEDARLIILQRLVHDVRAMLEDGIVRLPTTACTRSGSRQTAISAKLSNRIAG